MTIEDQTELTRLERFIQWREKNIPEKRFILLLSFIVGIGTALAALILKTLIGNIEHLLTERFDSTGANWLYLVYPIVGIYITSCFIRYIVRDDIGHGVTKILYAISRNQGKIKRHNTWTSVIASAITIGFGGSVGAEAPIVLTGSAIGSNLGSIFKLEHKTLMLLIGCGAAGAVCGLHFPDGRGRDAADGADPRSRPCSGASFQPRRDPRRQRGFHEHGPICG